MPPIKGNWRKSWQERHADQANRLSDRQYSMAKFLDALPDRVIPYGMFATLNQVQVRSFKIRGYLEERVVRGQKVAYWTKYGSQAVRTFSNREFDRVPTDKFSSTFSLELYDRSRS